MAVDRCICHNKPFEELLRIAREKNLDFAALSALTLCSTGCGMCEPYVRLMLTTGRTRFPVLSEMQVRAIMAATAPRSAAPPPAPPPPSPDPYYPAP